MPFAMKVVLCMDDQTTLPTRRPGNPHWKKGQSANPAGRPKIEGRIRKLAQRHSRRAIRRLAKLIDSTNERIALAASSAVLDRAIGRPAQGVELTGANGEPLRLSATVTDVAEAAKVY